MSEIVIRDVKPEEVDLVADIAVAAWQPIWQFYRRTLGDELFEAAYRDCETKKASQVRRACDPGTPTVARVVEVDGRVAGFITFFVDFPSGIGEIGNNAVHPDFQGMGLARKMYEHAFETMRSMGMRFVKVSTGGEGDPAHAPARRAYEKAGFSIKLPNVVYFRRL